MTKRWWVAAHGSQGSAIVVGKNLFDQCKQDVDRLRNVAKFLLGAAF
jgi:isoleucyl-tRNA synthetase